MLSFIWENLSTIIVGLVLLGIVVAVVVSMIRKKIRGKSSGCGCGCADCQMNSDCSAK